MSVGVAFATPALFTAIFATARPSERGAASGTASAAIDLAFGAGPILLGLVAQARGIPTTFAVGAGIALAGRRLGPAAGPGASVLGGDQDPERDVGDELRAPAAGS